MSKIGRQRRIPAAQGTPIAAWKLPPVAGGAVIRAENTGARQRRTRVEAFEAAVAATGSLEQELAENVRSGGFSPGVSARELEAIVAQATEEGRREGLASGHAEGYIAGERAGREEGLAASRADLAQAAGRLARMLDVLHAPLQEQQEALRDALLEAVTRIARAVLRAETLAQPERIVHVIDEALAALPVGAHNVRVFVSQVDRALLEDFGEGDAFPALLVDAALAPGDCRVETDDSLVDFTQSQRFAAIIEQFLGHPECSGA